RRNLSRDTVSVIQTQCYVEIRDRYLRPTRPQQQFALSPVRELAADRGRADRGLAIRNRVLDATEAGVNVRAKEKCLRARRLDSVEGRDCGVGSADDTPGDRNFPAGVGSRSGASAPCAFDAEAAYPSIASSIRSKSSRRTA